MTSLCFVAILTPEWFSYEDCEFFLEEIFEFLHRRYEGQRPPISFFNSAYLQTMKVFMDGIRIHEKSLGDLVNQVGMWQHLWTVWNPPLKTTSTAVDRSTNKAPNVDIQVELQKIQGLTRTLQSQQDRQQNQFRFISQQRKYTGSGGKGKGFERDRSRERHTSSRDKGGGRGRPPLRWSLRR